MDTEKTAISGRRLSAEKRERQLSQAALRVFSERGFSGATTREIASAAGVSEAVIFQHFDSKEELYTSILDEIDEPHIFAEWLEEMQIHAAKKRDVKLFEAIAAKITEFAEQSSLVRLVLYSALEGHEIIEIFRRRQMFPVFELLRDYIVERQSDGAFQVCDANIAARAFLGAQIYHAVVENLFHGDSLELSNETAIKNYTRLALDGLRRQPARNEKSRLVIAEARTK